MNTQQNNISTATRRSRLHLCIRLALAGSLLASGLAFAQLQDHGIADPAVGWPQWYRDFGNLPLGLCKSQQPSLNAAAGAAPMCFPITPNTTGGYAGNIGDEIFYMNLNANITNGGIDLRYVTGLEAAYGNAAGTPTKGQEIVFARVRFVMHVLRPECTGNFRIIHPWGDQTFNVTQVGPRALFDTIDIPLGALLDFEGALNGPVGPFLHWDGNGDEIPLARTGANGLLVNGDEFIGDPSVQHSYTGSPFIERKNDGTPQYLLADGTPQHQNYLKVIAPVGCDIGGAADGEGTNVQIEPLGFLMGQVWTAPIPTATKITQAEFTRTAATTTVDVWAKSAANQELLLTGSGLSGVKMTEEIDDFGIKTGHYQAHLELIGGAALPPVVDVVNTTSNPVLKTSSALSDIVHIHRVDFNPQTNVLCVSAQSSDTNSPNGLPPELTLAGAYPATLTTVAKPDCPAAELGDSTASITLPQGNPGPLNRSPAKVQVVSGLFGSETEQVTVLNGKPDNGPAPLSVTSDTFAAVSGGTTSRLDVGSNDATKGQIVIVDQPSITVVDPVTNQQSTQIVGTATGSVSGGLVSFTPNLGTAGPVTFTYLVKTVDGVSNLVNVDLDVVFVASPPTGNPDNFAVLRTNNATGFTAKVLANDTAATGTSIDPASISIPPGSQGTRGTATANNNGTITYRPTVGIAAGNDAFFYTVKNTAGAASTPIRVDVVVENSAESVSINRNRFTNVAGGLRWDVRFTTSWFGAPLTPSGTCYLIRVNNVNIPSPRKIATVAVDATGAVQIQAIGTKLYDAANYDPNVDVPLVPSKTNYTVRCGTSNLVNPLPGLTVGSTADNSTTSP